MTERSPKKNRTEQKRPFQQVMPRSWLPKEPAAKCSKTSQEMPFYGSVCVLFSEPHVCMLLYMGSLVLLSAFDAVQF